MTLLPVLLPEGYTAKVSVNDKLTIGQIMAERKNFSAENIVDIAVFFNVLPQDCVKLLKKNLGDKITEGEVLAEKKGGFGKTSKKLISKFSGTVVRIDETKGIVGIKGLVEKESSEVIISPVDGTVDFCNNEKIVIKTEKNAILALDAVGAQAEGELVFLEKLEETELDSGIKGKIILAESIDKVSLFKAIVLDVVGIIVTELRDTDFIDLGLKKITTPVMTIGEEDYKKLSKANGKQVYLGGKDKTIVIL
jgi:hypothetical protein